MKYELKAPFMITPRLMVGVKVQGPGGKPDFISIIYAGRTDDGRMRYHYYIDLSDGREHEGNDLRSGVGGGNLQEGMEFLLSFLGAAGEAYSYKFRHGLADPENLDMFPDYINQWAYLNDSDLSILNVELQERRGELVKEVA